MLQKVVALLVGFLVAFGASAAVVGLRAKPATPAPPASAAHDSAGAKGTAKHMVAHSNSVTKEKESEHVTPGADSSGAAEAPAASKHPAPAHASTPASVPSNAGARAEANAEPAKHEVARDSTAGAGREPMGFAVSPERRLAKIFTAMQPKDAARVLEQMSDGDVQAIVAMLGDRQAAAVLANFPPQRAAVISKLAMRGGAK